jgi:hypothetical protein
MIVSDEEEGAGVVAAVAGTVWASTAVDAASHPKMAASRERGWERMV